MAEPNSEKQVLNKIKKYCDNFDFPTLVFDSNSVCVYSKGVSVKTGTKSDTISDIVFSPECSSFSSAMFVVKGVQYCAKITNVDGYYICALFDSKTLGNYARNTDFFTKFMTSVNIVEYNFAMLWDEIENLKALGNEKLVSKLEYNLTKTSRVVGNIYEYVSLLCKKPNEVRIDCSHMLSGIVNRCNTLLSKCGRSIEFLSDSDCYICADHRFAVSALVCAIHNSLLYSPRECVPLITLSKTTIDKKEYVVIKFVNDNIYFVDRERPFVENDIVTGKTGVGIPLIKSFVEQINGEFICDDINGTFTAVMKIPAFKPFDKNAVFFDCEDYTHYDTGIPDFLELQMLEVVDLFSL